jgi:tetratricopeptide (TPR) repeat protein
MTADENDLRGATVRLDLLHGGNRQFVGSGFFVGSELILTCSHVVAGHAGADIIMSWSGKEWAAELVAVMPDPFPTTTGTLSSTLPDLALLRCTGSGGRPILFDPLPPDPAGSFLFYGYSKEVDGEVLGHPVRANADGMVDVPNPAMRLFQLATDRILQGMSGSAVMSEASGRVVAVAKRRLTGMGASYGVPVAEVSSSLPLVAAAQKDLAQAFEKEEIKRRMVYLPAPNTFFVGRDDAMKELIARLGGSRVAAVIGPAGVGKSALAREYVSRSLGRFREVLWLDARDQFASRRGLFATAAGIGLDPVDNEEELLKRIGNTLTMAGPWLLVLDDLRDSRLGRGLVDAAGSAARVLITSQLNDFRAVGVPNAIRLTPLSIDEQDQLLTARLGTTAAEGSLERLREPSDTMPGDVERRAAIALETRLKSGQYADMPPRSEERLVAALADPSTGALLRLGAVLADAPIPLVLVARSPEYAIGAAIALSIISLAELDPSSRLARFSPDLAKTVRDLLSADDRTLWEQRARIAIVSAYDAEFHSPHPIAFAGAMLPHALHLLHKPIRQADATNILLAAFAGRALLVQGDFWRAEQLLNPWSKVLDEAMAHQVGLKPAVEALSVLIEAKTARSDFKNAEREIDKLDRLLSSGAPIGDGAPDDLVKFVRYELATARAEIRLEQRRADEALALLIPAVEYLEKHPRGSVRTVFALRQLVRALMEERYITKALWLLPALTNATKNTPFAEEADAYAELYLGIAFERTAGDWFPSNKVQLNHAARHLERALAIAERTLPPLSEITASICANLGIVYGRGDEIGELTTEEAIKFYQRALDIRSRAYGQNSPRIRGTLRNLGRQLAKLGRRHEAEEMLVRALALDPRGVNALTRNILSDLVPLYEARHADKRLEQTRKRLNEINRVLSGGPSGSIRPGESGQERNFALMAAVATLSPARQ